MTQYRIVRGSLRDWRQTYRQGWWWHSYAKCSDCDDCDEQCHSPEGPFLTQAHARRHLLNTLRAAKVAKQIFAWPHMPPNAGWVPNSGHTKKPTLKPMRGIRHYGSRVVNILSIG